MPLQTTMNRHRAEKLYNEHQAIIVVSVYNTIFTNDICCGQIIDAVDAVKKSKFYKHRMKQCINLIEKEQRRYEKMINAIIGKKDMCNFFADSNDRFLENIEDDITKLHFAFKQVFDREKMEDSSLLAKVEVARTLCEFSCYQLDRRIADLAKVGAEFKNIPLSYLRLTTLSHLLSEAMDEFKPGKKINLDIDECQRALDVVMIKLGDVNAIANAIHRGNDEEC